MFVFGINLPVAELLFVTLVLVSVTLIIIIVQLVKVAKHIKVLDETTLEIRRYEAEEDVTVKQLKTYVANLSPADRRRVKASYARGAKLERKALKILLDGYEPAEAKNRLLGDGAPEDVATRAVNDAIFWIDRTRL